MHTPFSLVLNPTLTRSYGVAWAAATQWLWNFVVSYVTPMLEERFIHGGVFFFFATINIIS
jgi:Sugar (and other) transporter